MSILPPHTPGMSIGLFGGTFDPPHDAHRAACLIAMRRLGLDRVWWLVTPGNPLKDTRGLAPLADRIAAAKELANHPRIVVTGLEAAIGARYTYDTVSYLKAHCPGVRFVWIMGADNLRSFHRWQNWRRHRRSCSDRGGRPARPQPLCRRQHRRPCACPLPSARRQSAHARPADAAGLGLPAWAEIAVVVDGSARRPPIVAKPTSKLTKIKGLGTAGRLNPLTHRAYLMAASEFGAVLQ